MYCLKYSHSAACVSPVCPCLRQVSDRKCLCVWLDILLPAFAQSTKMDEDMNILSLRARSTYRRTSQHKSLLISLPPPSLSRHPPPPRGSLTLHPSVPCEGLGVAGGGVSLRGSCSCWSTAGRPAHPSAGKGWSPPPVHAWSGGCYTSSQRGPGESAPGCAWCWWPRPAQPTRPSWGNGVARWGCRRPPPPSAAGRKRSGTAPARRRSAAGERCS